MSRQDRALADVDRHSAWGIVVALVGVALLVGVIALLRGKAIFVIPLFLGVGAFLAARPRRRHNR